MVLKLPCKTGEMWHWKEEEKGEDGSKLTCRRDPELREADLLY
jgi:hypothetical protein